MNENEDVMLASAPCTLQVGAEPPFVYREYAQPPDLRRYVICAWTLEIGPGNQHHQQRVIPDGCSDIVWIGHASPLVVGPMTRPVLSTTEAGTTIVGLRFRPEAAASVLGVDAHELTDRRIPLDELWRRPFVEEMSQRFREERTTAGRLAVVQHCAATLRSTGGTPDATVQQAISLLAAGPRERVDGLARRLGVSERQLRRRFLVSAGYSPKVFHRIARFQRLLALANAGAAARFDMLALQAGYADQAHMTREVGRFAGVTPSALLGRVESALMLSDLLEET